MFFGVYKKHTVCIIACLLVRRLRGTCYNSCMVPTPKTVQRTYLLLLLLSTLSASLIWGVNTLFLLDAGLNNLEAFAANAFFTAGQVLFEIPTGIVADTWGRRVSYLLGAATLAVSTVLYLYMWEISAPFWGWALASVLLGLGFTFFSGATEAWLVDALHATGYRGQLEAVFAKGQIVTGVAMLTGSVTGGVIAQATNLGVPYIIRGVLLGLTLAAAFVLMKDIGFKPRSTKHYAREMKTILHKSIDHGLKNPPVKWVMVAGIFSGGVGVYTFYAMQPYLLELYGDPNAYSVAGLAAAIVAGAQIAGGLVAGRLRRVFHRRTSVLLINSFLGVGLLIGVGTIGNFWVVVGLLVLWGLAYAAVRPIRQAYINDLIRSDERATVLSFDSLLSSSGGVVVQPVLGKAADVWSYGTSYVIGAGFELLAIPFIYRARNLRVKADFVNSDTKKAPETEASLVNK